MLPIPGAGIGRVELPLLPPSPSGPNPTTPGTFSRMYDGLMTGEDRAAARTGLPTTMEVRPIIAPATDLSQPFQSPSAGGSKEFPGAVDPNALRVPGQADAQAAGPDPNPFQFLAPLKNGMDQTNALAKQSEALANEAAIGGDVDLHDVMIAAEKASVAMQLTLQVRNKLVEAYQDVMRMQV